MSPSRPVSPARRLRQTIHSNVKRRAKREARIQAQTRAITAWWEPASFKPPVVTSAEMKRRFGDPNSYAPALRRLGWTPCRIRAHGERLYAWLAPGTPTRPKPVKRRRLAAPLKARPLRRKR